MNDSELKEIETLAAELPEPSFRRAFEGDASAQSEVMERMGQLFREHLSPFKAERLSFLLLKKWYEEGNKETLRYLPNFCSTRSTESKDTESKMRDAIVYALEAESLGMARGSEFELYAAYSGRYPELSGADFRKADSYLRKAVKKGDPRALIVFGAVIETGSLREKISALSYYEKAGDNGSLDGYLFATRMLADKEFRAQVPDGASRYAEDAKQTIFHGRAEGYFHLAYAYMDGTLGKNINIAMMLLMEGAKLGDEKCSQARDSLFSLYNANSP